MSMQSKDNTCPHCDFKGNMTPVYGCACDCHGSGQQDKYANNIPKTYEEKQQDKLKPYKPGQQEDNTGHPTANTPDAQPLDNVSESRTPEPTDNFVRGFRLGMDYARNKVKVRKCDPGNHYMVDTGDPCWCWSDNCTICTKCGEQNHD